MTNRFSLENLIDDPVFRREDSSAVKTALAQLSIPESKAIARFYSLFAGPFNNPSFGHELLDLVDQQENIISNSQKAQDAFGWPSNFLVLSTMEGYSSLVYDLKQDKVYDVDFEGGDQLLLDQKLEPIHITFDDFLWSYFRDF